MYMFAGILCIALPLAAFLLAALRTRGLPVDPAAAAPIWGALAGLLGLLAVGTDAYVSHGGVPAAAGDAPVIAVRYLMLHAVVLAAIAILCGLQPANKERVAALAGWLFAFGIMGFCGALFLRTAGLVGLAGLAPVGGMALMLGWLALAIALSRRLKG